MDKIYEPFTRQASLKIPLKDYFREYSELLKNTKYSEIDKSTKEMIFPLMNVELSQARQNLMTQYCSINNLKIPIETSLDDEYNKRKRSDVKIPKKFFENTQLQTIKVLETYNDTFINQVKSRNGIQVNYEKSELDNNTTEQNITPNEDFLVYVRVYQPFKFNLYRNGKNYYPYLPKLRLQSVISILGDQTLCELREKIICTSDLSISTEISNNPGAKIGPMAKDVYKSGFFYIEDTFYNDTRDSNNIDYSNVIINWAEPRNIGPFKTAKMEDIKINSLCARFGFPWVYQHQGCCEHIIVLSDARLVTENDDLRLSAYPRIERIKPISGKNCTMCGILNVRWIIIEHEGIPHDTSYFCNKCFKSYNYIDGEKVGNFKAYRYPCIPELMNTKKN